MTIKNIEYSRIITRFAPSPTGLMHIGNARTALFSYLFAKNQHGTFILRIEDTDKDRSKPEYITSIFQDLSALGIEWDSSQVVYQSERSDIYEKFYQQLQAKGLIYHCFCSEDKLNFMRKLQLSRGLPPRYNGTCLSLSPKEIQEKIASHASYCWRFKVPKNITIEFDDLIKGKQTFNSNDFGDFIVKRASGAPSFMFCSVIDDVLQGVTHVLRAEDHVSNTPRQLLILQELGLTTPKYGHFCLLVNASEEGVTKLSKRHASGSIQDLLLQGYLPLALLNYLARLGHNYNNQENQLLNLKELYLNFNINNSTSNAAKHDIDHLKFWQKQAMLTMSNQELLDFIQKSNNFNFLEFASNKKITDKKITEFLNLIKNNILMPQEAITWLKILFADNWEELNLHLNKEEKNNFAQLDINLLIEVFNIIIHNNIKIDFNDLCNKIKSSGLPSKNLFINLRMVLTGKTAGPELKKLFELVGVERLKSRIQQIIALNN